MQNTNIQNAEVSSFYYYIGVRTFVHKLRQMKLLTATGKCNYIEKQMNVMPMNWMLQQVKRITLITIDS